MDNKDNIKNDHVPITLTWNVNAYAKANESPLKKIKNKLRPTDGSNGKINILQNVKGIVKPGELCAIMGASGAGKTTLLNILNFRNKGKLTIDGDVKLNGEVANWDLITRNSGYIQQDDLFISTMTVKEHISFMASLKMDYNYTKQEREERVEEVIKQLNLVKTVKTYIGQGDLVKGISGGEKRRLAFATEILTNPSLLFADEPTSGLDSFMAESMIEAMSDLANQGKTVICTIHQPSSQIFEKFNTLCLLAEGRLVYLGPTSDAIGYFSKLGYQVPDLYNPADFYIHTLAIGSNRQESLDKVKSITDNFESDPIYLQMLDKIEQTEREVSNEKEQNGPKKYDSSYFTQFKQLFARQIKTDIRNPLSTKILAFQSITISVFVGLIFLQLDNDEKGVQNRLGVLFMTLMQTNFGYIFAVLNSIPTELPLIYRETKNQSYAILPYFLVKVIAELPKFIILPFILCTIIYWMAGILNNFGVFIQVVLILVLNTQVAVAYGTFLSVLAPNVDVALGLAIPVFMPFLIFAGFFLSNESTPVYFVWIKYISWVFYANESINSIIWTNYGDVPCSIQKKPNSTCTPKNCFDDGNMVLDFLGFADDTVTMNVLIMILMYFVLNISSFVILRAKLKRY